MKRKQSSGYLPSLDGWRALAVLGVMMCHEVEWRVGGVSNDTLKAYGAWGIYIFFGISGLLICSRILEEEALLGRFRLKPFYVRRFFRIQPAALCYLGAIAILMLGGVLHESWMNWLSALLLYKNFLNLNTVTHDMFASHYWTLAMEEQFYIVLSLLLVTVKRHRIAIFSLIVFFTILGQVIARHHHPFDPGTEGRLYWQIQFLLIPSLCALLLRVAKIRSLAQRFLPPWLAFSFAGLYLLYERLRHPVAGLSLISYQYLSHESQILYFFSLWIVATVLHPRSWTTRFLETRPMRFIGRLSYSLYLWHFLFFTAARPVGEVTYAPLLFLSRFPLRYVMALGMAMLSYYFVEKPLIRLGHKLAPPATPGHEDLRVEPVASGHEHLAVAR